MKLSILTPTYNRAKLLVNLYYSIVKNSDYNVDIEWLVMDDGSTDNTEEVIKKYVNENKISIKYLKQENQGKMKALNNLIKHSTGDLIIECDSDDYFTDDAFEIIKKEYEINNSQENIYGLCFLKYDQNGNNMGNTFKTNITTMFDLYFKQGETGEKALVFFSNIRKSYKYKLEKDERFITEARMYHEMDLKYSIICINKPIMICDYQKDGYTKNYLEQFKKYPFGYFEYFKEIFDQDLKQITIKKRLYIIKHYILFEYLTRNKNRLKDIKGIFNKFLYIALYLPGIIKVRYLLKNNSILFDNT